MGHRAGVSVDAERGGVSSANEALAASFPTFRDRPEHPVSPGQTSQVSAYSKENTMPDVSRRNFLRNASLGAAATGVVALGGGGLFQAATSAGAAPLASQGDSPAAPAVDGTDIFAHVVDAKAGRITLFAGTKEVSYTNRDLAQQILRAAQ
jgi:hypothetical protein